MQRTFNTETTHWVGSCYCSFMPSGKMCNRQANLSKLYAFCVEKSSSSQLAVCTILPAFDSVVERCTVLLFAVFIDLCMLSLVIWYVRWFFFLGGIRIVLSRWAMNDPSSSGEPLGDLMDLLYTSSAAGKPGPLGGFISEMKTEDGGGTRIEEEWDSHVMLWRRGERVGKSKASMNRRLSEVRRSPLRPF